MADDPTPPQPPPAPTKTRAWVWFLLVAGLVALVAALARANPAAVSSTDDKARVLYLSLLLAVMVGGASRLRRDGVKRHLRNIALWLAIVAALALAYAYRDVFQDTAQRLQMAFGGARPVQTSAHELVIPRDESGHFLVMGRVNGQPVRFLVDTGASDTVLSPADARRLGIDTQGLNYGYPAETANGVGYGAAYTVDRLEIGPIRRYNFKLTINQAPMSASLLGMTFLGDLESYQVRGDKLTLSWKTPTP